MRTLPDDTTIDDSLIVEPTSEEVEAFGSVDSTVEPSRRDILRGGVRIALALGALALPFSLDGCVFAQNAQENATKPFREVKVDFKYTEPFKVVKEVEFVPERTIQLDPKLTEIVPYEGRAFVNRFSRDGTKAIFVEKVSLPNVSVYIYDLLTKKLYDASKLTPEEVHELLPEGDTNVVVVGKTTIDKVYDREVYVYDIAKRELINVSNNHDTRRGHWGASRRCTDRAPSANADYTKVAFISDRDGYPRIYVADLTTRTIIRVSKDGTQDSSPKISADGKKVLFNTSEGGTNRRRCLADLEAKTLTILEPRAIYDISDDGTKLAVQYSGMAGLLDLQDGTLTTIQEEGHKHRHVGISDDGSRMSYSSVNEGYPKPPYKIYVADFKEGVLLHMSDNETGIGYPIISSDGTKLAFTKAHHKRRGETGRKFIVRRTYITTLPQRK